MNEFVPIHTALDAAVKSLAASSDSPRLDAELLLARALDVPRSYLFAHPDDAMDPAAHERFQSSIERRVDGVPLAYITGEKEFWSMSLLVNPHTLIPRPDTETLIETVLTRMPRKGTQTILELGTGSGAIALALAKERPLSQVVATDHSAEALQTAKENARQHKLPNIEFVCGDWFEPLEGRKFNYVVSNPPYIALEDPVLKILKHEPQAALAAGVDGLDALGHLATHAGEYLVCGGELYLEHGADQAAAVFELLQGGGWSDITLTRDLAGNPRVTRAIWEKESPA